jgi:hypothetical protein
MLDGMALDEKLTIATEWFRRARNGEFDLSGPQARKFGDLLDDCQGQARIMAVQAHIDAGRILVLDTHLRLRGVAAPALELDWMPANDDGLMPASGGRK